MQLNYLTVTLSRKGTMHVHIVEKKLVQRLIYLFGSRSIVFNSCLFLTFGEMGLGISHSVSMKEMH